MDVWDGKGTQKGQPGVIKFDAAAKQRPESPSYSSSSVKSGGSNNNTMSEPILFSDAVWNLCNLRNLWLVNVGRQLPPRAHQCCC